MAETKKMTQREVANYLLAKYGDDEVVNSFATHFIETLDKKASYKGNAKNVEENETLRNLILEDLRGRENGVTVTELITSNTKLANFAMADGRPLSNQKATNILNKLVDEKVVIKTSDKKKSYFSIAE